MLELVKQKLTDDENSSKNLNNLNLDSVMDVLRQYLSNSSVHTKVAALKWIHHLFTEIHDKVYHNNAKSIGFTVKSILLISDVFSCK